MNKINGNYISDEKAHIRQSINDILTTPIGSRIQRRDYGSRIPDLIDRPMNHVLLLQLAACSVMALSKWEKRIQIQQFRPRLTDNSIICTIKAKTKDNQQDLTYDDIFLGAKS